MKKTIYLCDLCGEELKPKRKFGGTYTKAVFLRLKYFDVPEIEEKKKKKIHICPGCLAEIANRKYAIPEEIDQ